MEMRCRRVADGVGVLSCRKTDRIGRKKEMSVYLCRSLFHAYNCQSTSYVIYTRCGHKEKVGYILLARNPPYLLSKPLLVLDVTTVTLIRKLVHISKFLHGILSPLPHTLLHFLYFFHSYFQYFSEDVQNREIEHLLHTEAAVRLLYAAVLLSIAPVGG
jgi:hypothetical protein